MAELVAKVVVEDLPLYRQLAEFVIFVACCDDEIPDHIRQRAINLGERIQAMLDARMQAKEQQA